MQTKTIGIIGGGVSGLATAYEARRNAIKNKSSLKIHIFEQHPVLGGNADTVVVNLGERRSPTKGVSTYQRWADLGVNDINLTAYDRIKKIMKEIGYFDKDNPKLNKTMLPLENTETYFTWDNEVLLTDDNDLEQGVSDPAFTIATKDKGEFAYWISIIHEAADDVVGKDENLNIDITVKGFFDKVISKPKESLKKYTGSKEVNWDSPELKQILTEIRDHIFYPRISAMYFANDDGPENMLLAAPMCYYRIQESKDGGEADRRYFVGGSTAWLKALLQNLLSSKIEDPASAESNVSIEFHPDFQARAKVSKNKVHIFNENKPDQFYDVEKCVVTVHADDAARLLDFDASASPVENTVIDILKSISYTSSIAVCHSYVGLLPANRNQWRAYNVLIRKDSKQQPYNMTYLCNRHQNDAGIQQSERYDYNQMGLPQYFVTLNPQREIPDQYILQSVDVSEISDTLLAELPQLQTTGGEKFHYGRMPAGQSAVTHFKHNLIDKKCFLSQRELIKYHQTANILYFAGGWSNGSGLHEECWQQAERVSQLICPISA